MFARYTLKKPKAFFLGGAFFFAKTIVLERVYNQQFQGTMTLKVFDFQGIYIYNHTLRCNLHRGSKPCPDCRTTAAVCSLTFFSSHLRFADEKYDKLLLPTSTSLRSLEGVHSEGVAGHEGAVTQVPYSNVQSSQSDPVNRSMVVLLLNPFLDSLVTNQL